MNSNNDFKPKVVRAVYTDQRHAADISLLLNAYASDPLGGGKPLSDFVLSNLSSELAKLPHAFSLICYVSGKAAGLANCFDGFSTFTCKPLINIHDIVVVEEFRGLGISQLLLAEVEKMASEKGCGKITLEVLEENTIAKNAYRKFGFREYELDSSFGKAMFWQKEL